MRLQLARFCQKHVAFCNNNINNRLFTVWLIILVFSMIVSCAKHSKKIQNEYDAILIARCMAKCGDRVPNTNCVKSCLTTPMKKFGECPPKDTLSVFDSACIVVCQYDSDCPDTAKCCKHSCGVTCQRPKYLYQIDDALPPIPTNLTAIERRKAKGVILKWHGTKIKSPPPPSSTTPSPRIIYVVEERHHAGRHFIESRLGPWTVRQYTSKLSTTLRNVIKPGRWYQFRIAAVNENGTRGYSELYRQFTTQYSPRPPAAPNNLTVGPLWENNGTLWGELHWTPPQSDLPINRYKVFWSRRLQGATTVLDSVLVNHQTVPKEQTSFLLKDLKVGFQYFLQVQALAQYGRNRLKSDKAAIILNTTNYTNNNGSDTITPVITILDKRTNIKVQAFKVQKIFWSQKRLLARISWKSPVKMKKSNLKYIISWRARQCNMNNDDSSLQMQHSVTTENTRFDLYNLEFECKYRVSVQIAYDGIVQQRETSLYFTTPSCNEIREKTDKDKPHCL